MEYLFGTTREGYTDLYSDDIAKSRSIGKYFNEYVVKHINNSEKLYGYLPAGTNNMVPMFFKYDQYNFLGRNSHYIHVVSLGEESEYYKKEAFFDGFFYRFVDDEEIQKISMNGGCQNLPQEKIFPELISYKKPSVNALKLIVYNLIKKQPVVIVMDNHSYDAEAYRILMRDIFEYLPYSLRRWCSFATATADNQYFKVGIIPERIKTTASNCVRLYEDAVSRNYNDAEAVAVDYLFGLTPKQRKQCFDNYEVIFGQNEFYQAQNLIDFVKALKLGGAHYDVLLQSFLQRKYDSNVAIPEVIRAERMPYYTDKNNLDKIFRFDTIDPLAFIREPMDFWDDYADQIRFTYLLNPNADAYFEHAIEDFAYIDINESIYKEFHEESLYEDVDDYYKQKMIVVFNDFFRKFHKRIVAWGRLYEELKIKFSTEYNERMSIWWIQYQKNTSYTHPSDVIEDRALRESNRWGERFEALYKVDHNNRFDFHCIRTYIDDRIKKKCAEIRERYEQISKEIERRREIIDCEKADRMAKEKMPKFMEHLASFDKVILGEAAQDSLDVNGLVQNCPDSCQFLLEEYFVKYLLEKKQFYKIDERNKEGRIEEDPIYRHFLEVANFNWIRVGKRLESKSAYLSIYMSIHGCSDIMMLVEYLMDTRLFERVGKKGIEKLKSLIAKKTKALKKEDYPDEEMVSKAQAKVRDFLKGNKATKQQKQVLIVVNEILKVKKSTGSSKKSARNGRADRSNRSQSGNSTVIALVIAIACILVAISVAVVVCLDSFGPSDETTSSNVAGIIETTDTTTANGSQSTSESTTTTATTTTATTETTTESTSSVAEHVHSVNRWKKFDDNIHTGFCDSCAKTINGGHTPESGSENIVKKATHTEKGELQQTCSTCGGVYTVTIPVIEDCDFDEFGKCIICEKDNITNEESTAGETNE